MSKVIITVTDGPDNDGMVNATINFDPPLDTSQPETNLTAAQMSGFAAYHFLATGDVEAMFEQMLAANRAALGKSDDAA